MEKTEFGKKIIKENSLNDKPLTFLSIYLQHQYVSSGEGIFKIGKIP